MLWPFVAPSSYEVGLRRSAHFDLGVGLDLMPRPFRWRSLLFLLPACLPASVYPLSKHTCKGWIMEVGMEPLAQVSPCCSTGVGSEGELSRRSHLITVRQARVEGKKREGHSRQASPGPLVRVYPAIMVAPWGGRKERSCVKNQSDSIMIPWSDVVRRDARREACDGYVEESIPDECSRELELAEKVADSILPRRQDREPHGSATARRGGTG